MSDGPATDGGDVGRLADVLATIDLANADDPNRFGDRPLASVHGELASYWLEQLLTTPSDELVIAARGHHLRRWALARSDYPEGRVGYLRWRRDNKQVQADAVTTIAADAGFGRASVARIAELTLRKGLGSDPETQALEDAACLAFLGTQFDSMVAKLGHDHMVEVVAKTLKKMSPAAITLAGRVSLSADATAVLQEAVATGSEPAESAEPV